MEITLNFKKAVLNGEVRLPASKSISNRVLIINALADSPLPVENLADCDDTNSMLRVLNANGNRFDIGHAGTAMRFLTAFLSRIVGCWEITGSERMQQRPISVLVDALNRLGARIEYTGKPGCPPLRIQGSLLLGGEIEMPASVSSQYVSALMMIAPYMANGLKIRLTGKVVSRTYIEMTRQIMADFGAKVVFRESEIAIEPCPYTPVAFQVESDWSAASYFYELLAISGEGEIRMPGLLQHSTQGDSGQVGVWEQLGVSTRFESDGVVISAGKPKVSRLEYDFVEMPDLVQSFAVACCVMGIPFRFTGVETLRIKETDRLAALADELEKLGYILKIEGDNLLSWDGACKQAVKPEISTYHDHRMAMAFAPAALKHPGMVIVDKEVVSKSFPKFWEELQKFCVLQD